MTPPDIYELFAQGLQWLGHLNNLIGLASLIVSLVIWRTLRRSERQRQTMIDVVFFENNGEHRKRPLDVQIRRQDLTRAELLGVLGMLYPRDRVDIEHLKTLKVIDDLALVQSGDRDTLMIPVSREEFEGLFPTPRSPQ